MTYNLNSMKKKVDMNRVSASWGWWKPGNNIYIEESFGEEYLN